MVRLIRFALSLGFLSTPCLAADFEGHRDFSSASLVGQIEVRCTNTQPGQPTWASHFCRADIIEPKSNPELGAFDMAYFNHVATSDVNRFELEATHEDGSQRKKSGSFKFVNNRSSGWVNLWVYTLTQRPLLDQGVNQIKFKLFKGREIKESGEFVSKVDWSGERQCRSRTYFGSGNDCQNPSQLCDRFFREANLCR